MLEAIIAFGVIFVAGSLVVAVAFGAHKRKSFLVRVFLTLLQGAFGILILMNGLGALPGFVLLFGAPVYLVQFIANRNSSSDR